ncbi:MAG TPA: hypothetical protein VFD58_31140 [Blastocatellia bacterium]|nr:hypothetical protein [Blastocatellia bacterium]
MFQPAPSLIISHWYNLIENFNYSVHDYYTAVGAALEQRQIPEAANSHVDWKEGGLFSSKRTYLRVQRDRYVFDICAAPFGTGFFVSWWLGELRRANLFKMIAAVLALFLIGLFAVAVIFAEMSALFGTAVGGMLGLLSLPLVLVFISFVIRANPVGLEDTIIEIPVVGPIYERLFKPPTFYRIDTALMFQEAVHAAVMQVVDEITKARGVRALSESQRKPIMMEFYRR